MKVLEINLMDRIWIGIQGENGMREIRINMNAWLVGHPNGSITLWHKRHGDTEPTATGAALDRETGILSWVPTDTDTYYAGEGEAEIRLTENQRIKKSKKLITCVAESLTSGGATVGSDWASYINAVDDLRAAAAAAANDADDSAMDAEAYAIGTRGGSDVSSDDPAYQNNALYYAGEAAGSAEAAEGSADAAADSAAEAAASAETVGESASEAAGYATAAETSAGVASASASSAYASMQAAGTSETNAATSAAAADEFADAASASAGSAATSAGEAYTSAQAAASAAVTAGGKASEATASAASALESRNLAAASATAAAASETAAAGYAASAQTQAGLAEGHAENAEDQADLAAGSAADAEEYATSASGSATAAAASATSAASSATSAAASAESVEDSAAQIATNTTDISQLKNAFTLLDDLIPGTTQSIVYDSAGNVTQILHCTTGTSTAVRTDAFTYGEDEITEVRTLDTGESLTIVTDLATLETTTTYAAA